MYVLVPVTIEQRFTFCRNDAIDIKTFDSKQLEKLAEYYCHLIYCSFNSVTFPEYEKIVFVRSLLKKRQWSRYFKFISTLIQFIVYVESNGVWLLTAVAEAFK